jgi:hypothetical protein
MMAVKAAGTRYGLAKKATIIPVKIMNLESDLIEGFAQIWEHIVANKRESRSVIVCSKGTANPTTRDAIVNDPDLSALLVYFDAIMDLGTPIVFAAGNAREGATRQDIDTWPQLLESATTPVINVGAAKRDGGRKEDSQGGGQLTVHAPGDRVHSLKKDSRIDLFDGTSVGKYSTMINMICHIADSLISCSRCCRPHRNLSGPRRRAMGRQERQRTCRSDQDLSTERPIKLGPQSRCRQCPCHLEWC